MIVCLYWLLGVIIGLITFVIFGGFDATIHTFLGFINRRQRQLRRFQRPHRICLIRHGESQANVDTSKIFLKTFLLINFLCFVK